MRRTIYNRLSGIVLLAILFYVLPICSIAQGTIVLKGNLENLNSTPEILSANTIVFCGTTAQTISGANIINNLTVNNVAGLIIGGNTEVNGALTLNNGLVTLGSYNLLMGPSATVSGTTSATHMVVPTGSGQMQKQFTDGSGVARSFIYPVGDNTGTAEYSPVTLNFTTGNFSTGIAGVNLVNSAYSGLTGDYLSRYWNLSQSGITSFNCNAQFNYVPADVNGTEANIYCIRVNPSLATYSAANTSSHFLTASGLTTLGTFTGGKQAWQGNFYVLLEGPYNTGTNTMTTTLNTNNIIPANQPYNFSPINYTGPETHTIPLPAGVVDWIYIELRHAATPGAAGPSTWFAKAAAFVKSDGTLVDFSDGVSPVRFHQTQGTPGTDNIYPVIRHRNHLAIIADGNGLGTGTGATKNADGTYSYDFRTGIGQALGNSNGYKQINTSPVEYGMVAADIDQDGAVFVSDYNVWAQQVGNGPGYFAPDVDFDGNVFVSDYNKWALNVGTNNPVSMPLRPLYHSGVPQ
jgi:hypothetical protein